MARGNGSRWQIFPWVQDVSVRRGLNGALRASVLRAVDDGVFVMNGSNAESNSGFGRLSERGPRGKRFVWIRQNGPALQDSCVGLINGLGFIQFVCFERLMVSGSGQRNTGVCWATVMRFNVP